MVDKADSDLWWKDAVVYCVDVKTWLDTDGDGWGDFAGATRRLDYLRSLGVNCVWLLPFQPSPMQDDGYDISDYYAVHPRLGTLGDFVEFVRTAGNLGIRVIVDLVLNHTSDQHPWFTEARSSRESRYRDFYVWADEPPQPVPPPVFPGEQQSTWTFDEQTGQWYFHRYHDFMPDLNIANPEVRDEMHKIMGFWLELGVAGFRVDSVPFLVGHPDPDADVDPARNLRDIRAFVSRRSGNAMLLGEANIAPREQVRYFGDHGSDGVHTLFDFDTCAATWLSLAVGDATPLREHLADRPAFPENCSYVVFLRTHDELSFESLSEAERRRALDTLDPDGDERLYGRGLGRRLTPLLGGDEDRVRSATSLLLSLPGTPILFYGDEIGLGDHAELGGRLASRVPMQWSDGRNGGFSAAGGEELVRPVEAGGRYGYRTVNVASQVHDERSLLSWVRRAVQIRRECPEIGWGEWELLPADVDGVVVLRYAWQGGEVIVAHNLGGEPAKVVLPDGVDERWLRVLLAGPDGDHPPQATRTFELPGYGYRWMRRVRAGAETGL